MSLKKGKIKMEGHSGTWSIIDSIIHKEKEIHLLESETYGDEAEFLIVDDNGKLIMDDVYNGFEDLFYKEECEEDDGQ